VKIGYLNKCVFYTFQGSNVLSDLEKLEYDITQYQIDESFDYDSIDTEKTNFLIFNWSRYFTEYYDDPIDKEEYRKQGFVFTKKFFEIVEILSEKGFNFLIDNVMEADVYITPELVFFLEKFHQMKINSNRLAMIYNNSINMGSSIVRIRNFELNTFHFPHFFISTLFELPDIVDCKFEKETDFLILNRRLGLNKFKLLKTISDRGLLDKCLYTILSILPDTTYNLNKYAELNEVAKHIGLDRLPITLSDDIADVNDVLKDDTYLYRLNTNVFFKTKVNIIPETFLDYRIDDRFTNTIHITEKTWKAIYIGVPFVVSATNGHIETLHKFGFKTFNNVIDESYDLEEDVDIKLDKIVTSAIQLLDKYNTNEVLDIIEYNKALFKNIEHKKSIIEEYFIKDFQNIFKKNKKYI
jgi:hypothetical protein